jgi:hypothetical protein
MNQLLLPIKTLHVPERHVEWLKQANSAEYWEKRHWFYRFKTRFLRAHALSDGLDLQTIVDKCWCGDGIWRGIEGQIPEIYWATCWKCNGTGIYRTRKIVLIRWLLNGAIFHEPSHFNDCEWFTYKETFNGILKHGGVSEKAGRRAMIKLMLRYEPRQGYAILRYYFRRYIKDQTYATRWRSRRIIYRVRCFFVGDDEIPF